MCCTFGDQTDMEWQKAHNLPIKTAITETGEMTELAGKYKGLKIKDARRIIIKELKEKGLLKSQKPIKHMVNVHERCGTEIEFIKSKQWFVHYLDLKKDMLKWGTELNWHPEYMKHRYDNWVKGLQWDWLISNQRYFGIPFPVWYCKKCGKEMLAEDKQLPVDPLRDKPIRKCSCGSNEFEPEKDILNTWFTSSMTPQLAIKLMPENIGKKLFPMSLRPQAHEIITFWLFNTVFKSNIHFGKNPWKDVMISGFVTLEGEKMAKSKGNVIEPQAVMEKYGADALRYWAASSSLGEDLDYQEKEIVAGTRFVNKLFNASKFVFMNLKNHNNKKPRKLLEIDRIFLERVNEIIEKTTKSFLNYNYSQVKLIIDRFFWMSFCDNYLEIIKNRIYNGSKEEKESAKYVLYNSLLTILKIMAPITPFITEEIYQEYFKKSEGEKSIHLSKWPEKLAIKKEKSDDAAWEKFIEILEKVRKKKSEAKKSIKAEIILTIEKNDREIIKDCLQDLKAVTCSREIKDGSFKVEFVD